MCGGGGGGGGQVGVGGGRTKLHDEFKADTQRKKGKFQI